MNPWQSLQQLSLEESIAAFHGISKHLYEFVISEGEDKRVQKRIHHYHHQWCYPVVLSGLRLLGFHKEEQAAAVADDNKGEVGGTGSEGFPAAGAWGDPEDGGYNAGVGDNCRDHRTNNNENSH